jgi:hypothetical protein
VSGSYFGRAAFGAYPGRFRIAGIAALIAAVVASLWAVYTGHHHHHLRPVAGHAPASASAPADPSTGVSTSAAISSPVATVKPVTTPPTKPKPVPPPPPTHSSAPVAPPAPPSSTAKPGPGNTGVPAGTALRQVNGNQTYSTNGEVISGLDIHGLVTITGSNITLKDSIVRGPDSASGCTDEGVINIKGSGTVEDTEVDPTAATACMDGVWATSVTLLRVNIHGSVDGVKAGNNTTIEDSYIHDLHSFASDPNQGGGASHNDAVQTFDQDKNVSLIHNFFDVSADDNSDYQLTEDGGLPASNIHIEDNWLYGGGCSLNLSSKGGAAITSGSGIYVLNNRFGLGSTAYAGCPILLSESFTLTQLSGNVWDQNGEAIPKPQQHN